MRSNFFHQREVLAVIIVLLSLVFTQPVQAAHSLCPEIVPSSNQYTKEIMSSLKEGLLEPQVDSDNCAFVNGQKELTLGEAVKAICRASSFELQNLPDASCQAPADEAGIASFDWEFATCINNLYKQRILKTYTDETYPSTCPDASQTMRMGGMISMLARTVLEKPGVADGLSIYKVLSSAELYDGPDLAEVTSWGLPSPYIRYLHTLTCGRDLGFDASKDFSDRSFVRSYLTFESAANLLQHLHVSEDCAQKIEAKLESTSLSPDRISFIVRMLKKYYVVPDAPVKEEALSNGEQNFPSNGNFDFTAPSADEDSNIGAISSDGAGVTLPSSESDDEELVAPSDGSGIVVPAPAEEAGEIVAPSHDDIDLSNIGNGSAASTPALDYTSPHTLYNASSPAINGTYGSIGNGVDYSPSHTFANGLSTNAGTNGTYGAEDAIGSFGGDNVVNGNVQPAASDDRTVWSSPPLELSPEAERTLTDLSQGSSLEGVIGGNTDVQTSLQSHVGNVGATDLPDLGSSGTIIIDSDGSEFPRLQLQPNAENTAAMGGSPSLEAPLNIEIGGTPALSPEERAEQERQAAINAFHQVDAAAEADARERKKQELSDATHNFIETDRALSAKEDQAEEDEQKARRAFQSVAEAEAAAQKAKAEAAENEARRAFQAVAEEQETDNSDISEAEARNLFRTVDAENKKSKEKSSNEETEDEASEREVLNLLK